MSTAEKKKIKIWDFVELSKRIDSGELCTVEKAAEITGYSRAHLCRLCAWGRIECIQRGRRYYLTAAQVSKLIRPVAARV